jgi:ATP-binding protein involved in chromosome partitioning
VRTHSQITGDGGSRVAEQIADLEARIARRMATIRQIVAVGSGKGGVGKSTLTRQLAALLVASGRRVGILDADLNGPSQARFGGVAGVPPLPGEDGMVLPRSREGVPILSVGSVVGEGAALAWPGQETGHSHVWRATREFAHLAELLAAADWGRLDVLLVDLPPGPERTAQFVDFLGPRAAVVLVSIPTAVARGVVARSLDALRPLPNRVLGYVENMTGLFIDEASPAALALPCIGRVPFDRDLAALCDRGVPVTEVPCAATSALETIARELLHRLEEPR